MNKYIERMTSLKMDHKVIIIIFTIIQIINITNAVQCSSETVPELREFETLASYQGNKISFDATTSNFTGNFVKILKIKEKLEKLDFVSYTSEFIIRLILNNENITSIEEGTFYGLYCLESLELQNNKIITVNSGMFDYVDHIRYLNLSYNLIDTISRNAFQNLTHMISLDLSFNRIKQFDSLSLEILPKLHAFNISNNFLSTFNLSNFLTVPSIRFLDLSNNKLAKLIFPNNETFGDLSRFMLHENNLSNIQFFYLKKCMPHLAYLTLEGNNWDCEYLSSIVKLLKDSNIMFDPHNKTIINADGIDCSIISPLVTSTSAPSAGEPKDESKHFDELKNNQGKVLEKILDLKNVITYLFIFIILFVIFDVTMKAGCLDYIRIFRARREALIDDSNVESLRLLSTPRL